jgi:general secretion pathway protein M
MKAQIDRQTLATGLLLLLLALPLVGLAAYVANKYDWATRGLAELEPRYARLLGLEASQAELKQAQAAAAQHLARYAYPSARDVTQTGTDAQQRVRSIATVAGLAVVSSQVMPAKTEGAFDRIPLVVRLEGDLSSVQAMLAVLGSEAPIIHFDGMTLQAVGGPRPDAPPRMAIQFSLFVLRNRT